MTDLGAEARVVVVSHIDGSLDSFEKSLEQSCPDWTDARGYRKNNLIAVVVDTGGHHSGIYYGSLWRAALDSKWMTINGQMITFFRHADYNGGIGFGLVQIWKSLSAPTIPQATSTTVINQPADNTRFWNFLLMCFIGVSLFGLGYAAWNVWKIVHRHTLDRKKAQQDALIAQQEAQSLFAEAANGTLAYDVKEHPDAGKVLDAATDAFSNLGRGNSDPSNDKLSEGEYIAIRERYSKCSESFRKVKQMVAGTYTEPIHLSGQENTHAPYGSAPSAASSSSSHIHYRSSPIIHEHIVFSDPVAQPIIVPVYQPYEQPYNPPTPPPPPPPPASSDDEGGGSSSWGSSSSDDSSSSSYDSGSYDSGGSSSFDSGSSSFSDPGGGGSSDW